MALLLLSLGTGSLLFAQDHTIVKQTIDGGGGQQVGSDFSVNGGIGQHDASTLIGSGDHQISGGFWPVSVNQPPPETLFADGFES